MLLFKPHFCPLALISLLVLINGLRAQESQLVDVELMNGFKDFNGESLSDHEKVLPVKKQLELIGKRVAQGTTSEGIKPVVDLLLELANSPKECTDHVLHLFASIRLANERIFLEKGRIIEFLRLLAAPLPLEQCNKSIHLHYASLAPKLELTEKSQASLKALEPIKVAGLKCEGYYALDWYLRLSGEYENHKGCLKKLERFSWSIEENLYPTLAKLAANDPKFNSFHEKTHTAPIVGDNNHLKGTVSEAKQEFKQLIVEYFYQPCRQFHSQLGETLDSLEAIQLGRNDPQTFNPDLDLIWQLTPEFKVHLYQNIQCRKIIHHFELNFDGMFGLFYSKSKNLHRQSKLVASGPKRKTEVEQSLHNFNQLYDTSVFREPENFMESAKILFEKSPLKPDIQMAYSLLSNLAQASECDDKVTESLALIKSESNFIDYGGVETKVRNIVEKLVTALPKDQCNEYFESKYGQLKSKIDRKQVAPIFDMLDPTKNHYYSDEVKDTPTIFDWFLSADGNPHTNVHMPFLTEYSWEGRYFLELVEKLAKQDENFANYLRLREGSEHINLVKEESLDDYRAKTSLKTAFGVHVLEPCNQFEASVGQFFNGFQGYKTVLSLGKFEDSVEIVRKHSSEFKLDYYQHLFCRWFARKFDQEFQKTFVDHYYKKPTVTERKVVVEQPRNIYNVKRSKHSFMDYMGRVIGGIPMRRERQRR